MSSSKLSKSHPDPSLPLSFASLPLGVSTTSRTPFPLGGVLTAGGTARVGAGGWGTSRGSLTGGGTGVNDPAIGATLEDRAFLKSSRPSAISLLRSGVSPLLRRLDNASCPRFNSSNRLLLVSRETGVRILVGVPPSRADDGTGCLGVEDFATGGCPCGCENDSLLVASLGGG